MRNEALVHHAAELIAQADALVIAAGAGMGVDSGMPDFRGDGGFWQAYPALGKAGMRFVDVANPQAFRRSPAMAWGFYGHRLHMYRHTVPHAGFALLKQWGHGMLHGCAVFTSNVDGQFQRAGFAPELVYECHGSIHHLQCLQPCSSQIWPCDGFEPDVDTAACLLRNPAPLCPLCGGMARPNILMFGDGDWLDERSRRQAHALQEWLGKAMRPVVIEIGAGTAVPSARHFSHQVIAQHGGRLVRLNPSEAAVPSGMDVGLAMGALAGLRAINEVLQGTGRYG